MQLDWSMMHTRKEKADSVWAQVQQDSSRTVPAHLKNQMSTKSVKGQETDLGDHTNFMSISGNFIYLFIF